MRDQILIAAGFAVVFLAAGYFAGVWLRSRPGWRRPAFIGIVVVGAVAIAIALVRGQEFVVAAAIGATFGLLNGARHGLTRPFNGLSGKSGSEERS